VLHAPWVSPDFAPADQRPATSAGIDRIDDDEDDRIGTGTGFGAGAPLISATDRAHYRAAFRMVAHEAGAARKPPNKHDISLFLSAPRTVDLRYKLGQLNQQK
jgi:hypothetical protein